MSTIQNPKYDNDVVNLGYLNKRLESEKETSEETINRIPLNYSSPPNPPYYVNSLLLLNGQIYKCIKSRLQGSFTMSDWKIVVDTQEIDEAIKFIYDVNKLEYVEQEDNLIETFYQNDDPSLNWTTDVEKNKHVSDLWTVDNITQYQYTKFATNPVSYGWKQVSAPASLFDVIDGYKKIFLIEPTNYETDDLWLGKITKMAINSSETFKAEDWIERDDFVEGEKIEQEEYHKVYLLPKITEINRYTTSEIKKAIDEITLSVSQTYSTKTEVEEYVDGVKKEVAETYTTKSDMNAQIKIVSDQITTVVSKTTTQGESIEILEQEYSKIVQKTDEMNLEIRKTGNNLLKGTSLFDFSDWGRQTVLPYVESPTPPDPTVCEKWYCTENNGPFVNGKCYLYNNEWQPFDTTRKELEEQSKHLWGVTIIQNSFSKDNFYSQKFVRFEPYSLINTGQAILSTKCVDIQPSEEKLTLSYKMLTNISQGDFYVSIYLYSVYKGLDPNIDENAIFRERIVITPDELKTLDLQRYEFAIPKTENLVEAFVSETEPTTNLNYWLKLETAPLYSLYEKKDGVWVLSANKNGCKDSTGNIYYYCGNSFGKNIFCLLENNEYIARQVYLDFNLDCHYIDLVQEETPTPYKNCYWARESTNQVFRAKYDGDNFVEWVSLDTSYQEAVENGGEFLPPFVKPIGTVDLGDIKLEYGDYSEWNSNTNEITGQNYNFNDKGYTIKKGNTEMYMDDDEIKATNNGVVTFKLDDDKLMGNKGVFNELHIQELITKKISIKGQTMFGRFIDDGGDN